MIIRLKSLPSSNKTEDYSFRPTTEFVDISFSSFICISYSGDNEDYAETDFEWEDRI